MLIFNIYAKNQLPKLKLYWTQFQYHVIKISTLSLYNSCFLNPSIYISIRLINNKLFAVFHSIIIYLAVVSPIKYFLHISVFISELFFNLIPIELEIDQKSINSFSYQLETTTCLFLGYLLSLRNEVMININCICTRQYQLLSTLIKI